MSLVTLGYWGCILAGALAGHAAGGWTTELEGAAMGLAQFWLVAFLIHLFLDNGTPEPEEASDWPSAGTVPLGTRFADFFRFTLRISTFPLALLIALPGSAYVDDLDAEGKALLAAAVLLAVALVLLVLPFSTWRICTLLWIGLG